jgi:hypothetical protein
MPLKLKKLSTIERESSSDISLEEATQLWVAEKINGRKKVNGKKYYLIKWKNFPENESTWEPVDKISNAIDLINEFEGRMTASSDKNTGKEEPNVPTTPECKGALDVNCPKKVKKIEKHGSFFICTIKWKKEPGWIIGDSEVDFDELSLRNPLLLSEYLKMQLLQN